MPRSASMTIGVALLRPVECLAEDDQRQNLVEMGLDLVVEGAVAARVVGGGLPQPDPQARDAGGGTGEVVVGGGGGDPGEGESGGNPLDDDQRAPRPGRPPVV